jgi:hypothetical protein
MPKPDPVTHLVDQGLVERSESVVPKDTDRLHLPSIVRGWVFSAIGESIEIYNNTVVLRSILIAAGESGVAKDSLAIIVDN